MIDPLWLLIGLLGQACMSLRFLVQWLASEHHKRSVMPISFWYFSIAGGVVLLAYAVHRHDAVFSVGQACGLVVYARNVFLHRQPSLEA